MKNIMAENEILGGILYNNKIAAECISELTIEDFYSTKNRKLFTSMRNLYGKGKTINLTNLVEDIGSNNLDKVGGVSYISEILLNGMSIIPKEYIDILKDKSYRRKALKTLKEAIRDLENSKGDINEIALNVQNRLIKDMYSKKKILNDEELIGKALVEIENRYNQGGGICGMETGFSTFDKALNGLKRGELVILGGRPAMGKTVTALNMLDGLAQNGYNVLICEMEMTEESIGMRRLAAHSNIDNSKIQRGNLNDSEFEKIADSYNKLSKRGHVYTDCEYRQNIITIGAKARAIKENNGLDVLIIDYLGLMEVKNNENRAIAIGEVTRGLKILAKELNINIILLCQLSRSVEQRSNKRPLLSDLRESGSIEQDADVVIFTYRDDYYNTDSDDKNIMELIVSKNRNGKTGTLKFKYYDKYQRLQSIF